MDSAQLHEILVTSNLMSSTSFLCTIVYIHLTPNLTFLIP